MTLLGHDTTYVARALRGLRTMLFPRTRPRVRPRRAAVIAHRGSSRGAPENTIEGCRAATEDGADGVEVDVCVTRDGGLVLWHDRNPDSFVAVARQGGAEGRAFSPRVPEFRSELRKPITELTLTEVLDTHSYELTAEGGEPGAESHVGPTLFDDFAAWAAGEPRARVLVLDVKLSVAEREHVLPLIDGVARALATHEALPSRELYLLAVHREVYEALEAAMRGRSDLGRAVPVPDFELPGVIEVAAELRTRHVSIGKNPRRTWASTRDDLVVAVRAREAGLLDWVLVWTANDERVLRELGRLAIDAVLTDDVAYARRILDAEHGRHLALLRRREQARIRIPSDRVR